MNHKKGSETSTESDKKESEGSDKKDDKKSGSS